MKYDPLFGDWVCRYIKRTYARLNLPLDLSPNEIKVLFGLFLQNAPVNSKALCARLSMAPALVCRALDGLLAKNYVTVSPVAGDRRSHHIRLSDARKGDLEHLKGLYEECAAQLTRDIPESDVDAFFRVLTTLRAKAEGL